MFLMLCIAFEITTWACIAPVAFMLATARHRHRRFALASTFAFAVTSTGLNAGFTLASQTSLPLFPLILGILALGSLATLTLSDIDARRPWFKHGTAGLVGLRLVMGIVSLSLESLARWVEHGFGACLYGFIAIELMYAVEPTVRARQVFVTLIQGCFIVIGIVYTTIDCLLRPDEFMALFMHHETTLILLAVFSLVVLLDLRRNEISIVTGVPYLLYGSLMSVHHQPSAFEKSLHVVYGITLILIGLSMIIETLLPTSNQPIFFALQPLLFLFAAAVMATAPPEVVAIARAHYIELQLWLTIVGVLAGLISLYFLGACCLYERLLRHNASPYLQADSTDSQETLFDESRHLDKV